LAAELSRGRRRGRQSLDPADLELELVAVEAGQQAHWYRNPQRLRGMAAPLSVRDQLAYPLGRRGAADLQHHGHLPECPTGTLQAELVRRAEQAANLGRGVLDLNLV
jgi:hypothetical protein